MYKCFCFKGPKQSTKTSGFLNTHVESVLCELLHLSLQNLPCESKVGEGPREWWPVHTAPGCAGYRAPNHSTALPSVQSDKVKHLSTALWVQFKVIISRIDQRKLTQVPNEGGSVQHWVTFPLWVAFSAQWKLAIKNRSRPTKKLLRVKTSATMDHCQLSLDTANSPPASTAPGPGPANLTVRDDRHSIPLMTFHFSLWSRCKNRNESLLFYIQNSRLQKFNFLLVFYLS